MTTTNQISSFSVTSINELPGIAMLVWGRNKSLSVSVEVGDDVFVFSSNCLYSHAAPGGEIEMRFCGSREAYAMANRFARAVSRHGYVAAASSFKFIVAQFVRGDYL